jgi:L-alanine-DL-glutamate epimerase-like enolase superfamily enzyme
MTRVIVAGSRTFDDYPLLKEVLDKELKGFGNVTIVSGTAEGADRLGEQYAFFRSLPVERYPANWTQHGRSAGMVRNTKMAEVSHVLVAFWDGVSSGTKHMINVAKEKGLKVVVIKF